MHTAGIAIIAVAVAASIACYLSGTRELYVLRGPSIRITLSKPGSALDENYAAVSVRLQAALVVLFLLGLGMLLLARVAK